MTARRAWTWFAFLGLVGLYTLAISSYPLQDPDEGRYAAIPLKMLTSGDWVTPRLNGAGYFEKPPLLYWLVALSFSVFGVSEAAARLVPAGAAIATVAILWTLGRRFVGGRAAGFGAAFLATSPLFFAIGQAVVIDGILTLCWTATLVSVWMVRNSAGRERQAWVFAAVVATALGVLAKGLVAIAVPGLSALLWLGLERDFSAMRAFLRPAPILGFLALTVPWFVLVSRANPDFLEFFFIREHFGRYMEGVGHREGPFYYIPVLLGGPLPWTGLAFGLLWSVSGREAFKGFRDRALLRFLGIWAAVVIGFFSIAGSKLATYVLPAFPPLALLLGIWVDRALDAGDACRQALRWVVLGVIGFGLVLLLAGVIGVGLVYTDGLDQIFEVADVRAISRATLLAGLAAAFGGGWVRRRLDSAVDGGDAALRLLVVVMGLFLLGVTPGREVGKTSQAMGRTIAANAKPDDHLVAYDKFMQSLEFYTGRRIVLIDNFGELAPSEAWTEDAGDWFWHRRKACRLPPGFTGWLPRGEPWFWRGSDRLDALWASDGQVFIATGVDQIAELEELLDPAPIEIVREHRRVLLAKQPLRRDARDGGGRSPE